MIENRWTEVGAREAIVRWGKSLGEDFALRLYTARLLGGDASLVLHGGGNVSSKGTLRTLLGDTVEALFIKGTGRDMARLEPADLPAVDLTAMRCLRSLAALDDAAMVNEFRTHLFDAGAPTPSIETLVHAFLPDKFVDHSHADAVLTLTNQPHGERLIRETLGDRVAVLPYVRPGFELAKAVADLFDKNRKVEGIVLLHHGLITFADDPKTSYERHIALVRACEEAVERKARARTTVAPVAKQEIAVRIAVAAPILRGLLARSIGDGEIPVAPILDARSSDTVLALLGGEKVARIAAQGSLTGDHLIRTKPWPMLVEKPNWNDPAALRAQFRAALDAFRARYERYIAAHGGSAATFDCAPRVVWLPGGGILACGSTRRDAGIAADIAEHTLVAQSNAEALGEYRSLPESDLFHMEFRGLQQLKLSAADRRPLAGRVVVISGAAGAIGSSIAEVCAKAGAHVALTDLDESRLAPVAGRINERYADAAFALRMDVTDEQNVRQGFDRIAAHFGGVDVIVPNAGVAHVAAIENLSAADFHRVMEVNAIGYLNFMREGVRVLKAQGIGGHIVVISSKNVFSPGKEFAAYSASKAAAHQLGRLAAIELAPDNIRVNMLTPDAVFGDAASPSGLWSDVAPHRSKTHHVAADDLPEFYRNRNLLKAKVTGRHVGNAVVFFASNATPTTGATLPIDGGLPDAFPR